MSAFWRRRGPLASLGTGVWRRAHDRYRRAVDRYHQMLEPVPAGPVRDRLEAEGARLAGALDEVVLICQRAQSYWDSAGLDIPPGGDAVHRALSRGATSAAQAAESVAMASVAARAADPVSAAARGDSAGRAVAQSVASVAAAAAALPD